MASLALAIPETGWAGPPAGCGNGVLDPGEGCDDGNRSGGDCCSPKCRLMECRPTGTGEPVWEELGPRLHGGRVTALAADPRDGLRLFAGSPAGGVWRSDDGGLRWSGAATWLAAVPLSALAVSAQALVAGTGAITDGGSVTPGVGVIHSGDGGAGWSISLLDEPAGFVASVLIWAGEPTRALAATDRGVLLSLDGGRTFRTALRGEAVSTLAQDPFDPDAVYAAGRNGLFRSADRGASWVRRSGWPLRETDSFGAGTVALALSRRTPDLLFVTVQVLSTFNRTDRGLLLRSHDGGRTFEELAPPPFCPAPDSCGFAQAVAVHPEDDHRLLVGGDRLYTSRDQGATWSVLAGPAAVHEIVLTPQGDYAAGASGVTALDAGWTAAGARNQGLAVASIVSLDAGGGRPPRLLAGTADTGTLLGLGDPPAWSVIYGAGRPAGTARFDPLEPDRLYVSLTRGRFFRSEDGGRSFQPIQQGLDLEPRALEPAPLEPSPLLPGTVFSGRMQLLRSDSAGGSWHAFRPPGNPEVYRIAASPFDPDRVYFSLSAGATLYKADGGHTEILPISQEPNLRVTSLWLDREAENILYVGLTDTAGHRGKVFKSYDFGQRWEDITPPGLPAVSSIVKDRFDALYAGTTVGVFRSANDGFTWSRFGAGLNGYGVTALNLDGASLFAGTTGRGVFRSRLREWVSIDSIPPGGLLRVDGRLVTAPYLADWPAGSSHRIEPYLLQTPDTRRELVSWSDGGAASHTVTTRRGNTSITVAVRELHRLSTAPAAGGELIAHPSSPDGFYLSGSHVFLMAAPSPSHRFSGFTGDVSGAQEELGFAVMDRPRSVGARFEPLQLQVRSEPPGLALAVDGQQVTTPSSHRWRAGSRHRVAAPEQWDPDPAASGLLVFDGWSDLLDREHEVTLLRDSFVTGVTARYIPTFAALQVPPGAARSLRTPGVRDAARIASLAVRPPAGTGTPGVLQVLRGTAEGVVTTELALAPAADRDVLHVFVSGGDRTRTRLVLHNPGDAEATVSLLLRAADGTGLAAQTDALRLPPGGQAVANLEDRLPLPSPYEGLLTLRADRPLAASVQAVRFNLRPSTFLDPILLAPFLEGAAGVPATPRVQVLLLTPDTVHRLVLINPGPGALHGQWRVLDEAGASLASSGPYSLPAGGHLRLDLRPATPAGTRTAQVRIEPAAGQAPPLVQLVEEQTVGSSADGPLILPRALPPSRSGARFLAPVDWTRRDTEVVLTNTGPAARQVRISLRALDGAEVAAVTAAVEAGRQLHVSSREAFPGLVVQRGFLAGDCDGPLELVGVFRQVNGRGEEILAGFPLPDPEAAPGAEVRLPFAIDGDTWSSEWWLFNPSPLALMPQLAFRGPGGERRQLALEEP